MTFISSEKIPKPRILLLDFDDEVKNDLETNGFFVTCGQSGFSGKKQNLPVHPSEVEIVFWNFSKLSSIDGLDHYSDSYRIHYISYPKNLRPYFDYLKSKHGPVVFFLGQNNDSVNPISSLMGLEFTVSPRETTTIFPVDQDTPIGLSLNRFVREENITHSVYWQGNLINYEKFFLDEARNHFVGYVENEILILPHIANKSEAMLCLLQDVFPTTCSDSVYPTRNTFKWLEEEEFYVPAVKDKLKDKEKIVEKFQEEIKRLDLETNLERTKYHYLNQSLISDDSDNFAETEKLKTQIVKMLEVCGFEVDDIDAIKKELNEALKEDLQIRDKEYFALVEIKGTDGAAKANWVKKDLLSHVAIFKACNPEIEKLSSMVVFNHERRKHPNERKEPFVGDKDLIEYSKSLDISIVPVYELYRLTCAVLFKNFPKDEALKLLKISGLFRFSSK